MENNQHACHLWKDNQKQELSHCLLGNDILPISESIALISEELGLAARYVKHIPILAPSQK